MTEENFSKIIKQKIENCKLSAVNNMFDFIEDSKLRRKLTKSYRETVFVKNLTEKLSINCSDAHPLNEIQIIHYASIYEAILDYILETYFAIETGDLLKCTKYTKRTIPNEFKISDSKGALFLCRQKEEIKRLVDVQFGDRVKKAVDLGLVDSCIQADIVKLYDYRNHIHILKASKNEHNYTKQMVSIFCKEDTLINFCQRIKNSIPNSK
jgi:hypothetical protein